MVAETILAQLGGNKFIAMTGAKNFVKTPYSIKFNIPRAKHGINTVVIELNSDDTYKVLFYKFNRARFEMYLISSVESIMVDSLRSVFEEKTNLFTSL